MSLSCSSPALALATAGRPARAQPPPPALLGHGAGRLRPPGGSRPLIAAPAPSAASRQPCRQRRRALPAGVWAGDLPIVRWQHEQCLQILFIDRSDTVRARFALGMFERISAWNGCSRSLAGTPCGLEAAAGSRPGLGTQAGLFGVASAWQLRPHLFTTSRLRFEADDIDRFDLLICLDSSVQAGVLKAVSADRPNEPASYVQRICCLSDFLMYCTDTGLLQPGSSAVLDRQLRSQVALALPALRPSAARVAAAAAASPGAASLAADDSTGGEAAQVAIPSYMLPTGIPRPPLSSTDSSVGNSGGGVASADEQWERMALMLAVCCAGLVRYLLDCGPEETTGYSID